MKPVRVTVWVEPAFASRRSKILPRSTQTHEDFVEQLRQGGLDAHLSWEGAEPESDQGFLIAHKLFSTTDLQTWPKEKRARTMLIGAHETHDDAWASRLVSDGFLGVITATDWRQFVDRRFVFWPLVIHGPVSVRTAAGLTDPANHAMKLGQTLARYFRAALESSSTEA